MSTRSDQGYFIDQCRETIAKSVSACLQIDFEAAYAGVDLGKKGLDFTIAIPQLAECVRTHLLPTVQFILCDLLLIRSLKCPGLLARSHTGVLARMTRGQGKRPFHAGHLRSTISGTILVQLYGAANGWDAKLSENAIMHLFEIYAQAGQSGTLNEAPDRTKTGAPNALALWLSNIDSAMEELRSKGLLAGETQVGETTIPAWAVDLHKFKLDKPVVQKPDGTTIYMVRDIAGAIQRFERYQFDKMIYDLHCAQLFKILELMDAPFANRLEHINFGKGQRDEHSERRCQSSLKKFLDMAQESMLSQMQTNVEKFNNVEDPSSASDQIGMTCVKVWSVQHMCISRIDFLPGDTGAYLQYAHVRLCSVKRKVASTTDLLVEPKAREIAYVLACYPEVVRMAFKVSEPSTI
ncbi:arginyl-tRNA synthetase, partial [Mycena alexandri]